MSWKQISLLGAVLIFLQGYALLCILPPFEGIDEYQHLAYIVFLLEQRRLPILGQDTVPSTLLHQLRSFPLPERAAEHTASWQTQSYEEFWRRTASGAEKLGEGGRIELYQSQHPPLYYLAMAPVYRLLASYGNLVAVNLLRLINLLFLCGASFLFFLALEDRILPEENRLVPVLLIACHPLYISNACRVANDIMAIFFGILSLTFLMRLFQGKPVSAALWGALTLALGTWSKSTVLVWAPVWLLGFMLLFFRDRLAALRWKTVGAAVSFFLVYGGLCFPLFYRNWKQFGTFGAMVEYTYSSFKTRQAEGLFPLLFEVNWFRETSRFLGRLWIGGWSFVKLPIWLESLFVLILYLGLVAWLVTWIKRFMPGKSRVPQQERNPDCIFQSWITPVILAASVAWMLLGMFYHGLISQATYGTPSTNAWYFLLALPPFFCLVCQMFYFISRRLARIYVVGVTIFFLGIEIWGWFFTMLPYYTASSSPKVIYSRLTQLHPWFLHPALIPLLLVCIAWILIRLGRLTQLAFQKNSFIR